MKLFRVSRIDQYKEWDVCFLTVLAEDAKHAERLARVTFPADLRKAKLSVEEVDMDREQVVTMERCPDFKNYRAHDITFDVSYDWPDDIPFPW